MSNVIKKIKIKKQDGIFTDYIPIGAEAENINVDGESVEEKLNKIPYYYNNVADMKADTKLKAGDMVVTLGYYEPNDGGTNSFIIINELSTNPCIELENGLFAKFIIVNNILNVKQFGAKGNGLTDDTNACKLAFDFAKVNSNINEIHFPSGKYLINDTLLDGGINGLIISGEIPDYDGSLNTTIIRNDDFTIFNLSGEITLESRTMIRRNYIKNLYITDTANNYSSIAIKIYYAMYFKFENCLFACNNAMFHFRNFYDSYFVNCDFTGGGNQLNDTPLIAIDCGKHAGLNSVGWDNTNSIHFEVCRFERYRGSAIKIIEYTQPTTINPNYDPCVGTAVNKIWITNCKFESPYLTNDFTLNFINASNIYCNLSITALDGQTNMPAIVNFNNCSAVYGSIRISYYTTLVNEVEYNDFENPTMILYNSYKFNIDLIIGTISSHYLLDYLVDVTANNNTYRTIKINLPYSYKNKKLFSTSANPLSPAIQGVIDNYGNNSYNGLRMLYDNTLNDEWRVHTLYTNNTHQFRLSYKLDNNDTVNPLLITGGTSSHNIQVNTPLNVKNGLLINRNNQIQDNTSRSDRYIGFADNVPDSGYWLKGDIIFNANPSSGNYAGWICISGGSSATWKTFGAIS